MKNFMLGLTIVVTIFTVVIFGKFIYEEKEPLELLAQQYVNQDIGKGSKVEKNLKLKFLTLEKAKETIKESEIKEILTWLAHDEREGRMSGKQGNISAAKFIKEKFESLGLKTSLQKFKIRRMNPGPKNEVGDDFTHNIIGVLEGKTNRQIVIGAHMDHIGYGPSMSRSRRIAVHNGADDNASGTTAVLEIAEAFCKMDKPNHTLVFICFSAEEMGLIGSRYYVNNLKQEEKTNIDLMINFDMIGYLKGNEDLIITGAREVPNLSDIINNIERNYPFDAHPARGGGGGSDHASFGNANVPYAFFHTGTHRYYHTPDDDSHRIDFKGLCLVSKFAFEVVNEFDKSSTNTRRVSYPLMNDVHDHGEEHRYKIRFPELKK